MDAPLSWTSALPLGTSGRDAAPGHALPDMVVHRSPTGYVVCCPLLEALVGAPALPLPYTPQASAADVVAVLQRNNPTRTVRFDPAPLGEAHADASPAHLETRPDR